MDTDRLSSLYSTWRAFSTARDIFYKTGTEQNFWSNETFVHSYCTLRKAAEDAWISYSAYQRGESEASVRGKMNEVYSSRFD